MTPPQALELTLFEKSSAGRRGVTTPVAEADDAAIDRLLPLDSLRQAPAALPEVSQLDAMRHYVRLSHLNHAIDTGFYPLGSCTMKYNPKVCDAIASLPGFTQLHPMTDAALCQGTLEVMYRLQTLLADITGFDAVSLQPAAGAQGELTGLLMIKAFLASRGQAQRTQVVIPDSAHGTNPATAALCGFDVVEIKSGADGLVDLAALKAVLSERTAALMLTNPNTLGLFERDILEISRLTREAGGLMYYDGANLNAVMGQAKPAAMGFDVMHINTHKTFATPHGGGGPGCGPVACTQALAPFLPRPVATFDGERYALDWRRPQSVGKVKAFYGNVEMMIRAAAYILAYGADGLAQVTRDAVLNANYLKARLGALYDIPHAQRCKHEFVMTCRRQQSGDHPIRTMDIAKRMMDSGVHPMTVYFPLIVPDAMMIEPTETESRETLDRFVEVMTQIDRECRETPDLVREAPHSAPIARVDEVEAARRPTLAYFGCGADCNG
ncbi:MAG: aminomethyl-transferring glycine dehydrogenase subunit GcvPB [Vampirovibrionales bacterium]|nr:aminomethyl-transferring glycine dehydrogenase subunit GcvPB [Vampirovibrionales bacterium]